MFAAGKQMASWVQITFAVVGGIAQGLRRIRERTEADTQENACTDPEPAGENVESAKAVAQWRMVRPEAAPSRPSGRRVRRGKQLILDPAPPSGAAILSRCHGMGVNDGD